MVRIKEVKGSSIKDSRKEETIKITIISDVGVFSASAPNGKSKGKHETKSYKKSLEEDIIALENLSSYFSEDIIEKFEDLKRIEDIVEGHIGADTLFALESAVLKALAKEKKKEVWQLINPNAKKIPRFVGNCVGGGKHSELTSGKKPDFQEFLLIANEKNAEKNFEKNKDAREFVEKELEKKDTHFRKKVSDENGWRTSLTEKEILDILSKTNLDFGVDVAASSFYKRKKYSYENPIFKRTKEEQFFYINNLVKNYKLIYVEDPFEEEDFESFAKLLKENPNSMIVGDDLTVTNIKRLKKAIQMKSINAMIIKPNQNGSLVEVAEIVDICNKNNIKKIFSHRSGETEEDILADLAFGFEADFLKSGIIGKERESKLKRIIEIEKNLK